MQSAILKSHLALLGSRVADIVSPRDCVHCGEAAGESYRWLCEECAQKLPLIPSDKPRCALCGKPFEGSVQTERICPNCVEIKPKWERGSTLMMYEGVGETIVRRIKFHGERCLLEDVRHMLRERPDLAPMLRGATLIPVPLHSLRLRERGFNQSEWLARAFAKESGASCQNLLVRQRDTGTQTALSRQERLKNMRGAFALRRGAQIGPEQRYVLIDDVITTGATLNACADALVRAGAHSPSVLTLAHA